MTTQKPKNTSMKVLLALLLIVILIIGRWLYTTAQKNMETSPGVVLDTNTSVKVWEPLVLQGNINKLKELKSYTHTLLIEEDLYGIKSSSKNLYDYTGEVSIKGKVVDIKNNLAIIEVDEIIQIQDEDDKENLDSNKKITYLPQLWMLLDLGETNGFKVEVGTETIKINDTTGTGSTVLSINPFTCTPWEWLKDCDALLERFGDGVNQQFTSANDITYYNMTETNTWIAFNPRNIWYYFIPWAEKDIASFVDLISFLDNSGIETQVAEQSVESCISLEWTYAKPEDVDVSLDAVEKWLMTATIVWLTTNWSEMMCKLQVRLWKELSFKYISSEITKLAQEEDIVVDEIIEENPIDDQEELIEEGIEPETTSIWKWSANVNGLRVRSTPDIWNNVLWSINTSTIFDILQITDGRVQIIYEDRTARVMEQFITTQWVIENIAPVIEEPVAIEEETQDEEIEIVDSENNDEEDTEEEIVWGTTYTSSLWYTLTFSNKNIAYDGSINNNRLDGCIQSINVISWSEADNVNTSPDIVIHVCPQEKTDAWELIWSQNENYFYKESKTDNLVTEISVAGSLQ